MQQPKTICARPLRRPKAVNVENGEVMGKSGWNKEMAIAYNDGLEDGKANKPNMSMNYAFIACYIQGYRHGQKSYWRKIDYDPKASPRR